jgi:hypothetical protein
MRGAGGGGLFSAIKSPPDLWDLRVYDEREIRSKLVARRIIGIIIGVLNEFL